MLVHRHQHQQAGGGADERVGAKARGPAAVAALQADQRAGHQRGDQPETHLDVIAADAHDGFVKSSVVLFSKNYQGVRNAAVLESAARPRMPLHVVILAAGQGKRMRSALPKVLHRIAGRPLLAHVIDAARALRPERIFVVYGHGGADVRAAFEGAAVEWVEQARRLGTGHALMQSLRRIPRAATVLVLNGDVPLVRPEMLRRLVRAAGKGLAIATSDLSDPTGYGRVVRDSKGPLLRIVQPKGAPPK